jgi:hypothetical protein
LIRFLIVWSLLPLPVALVISLLWMQARGFFVDRRSRYKPDYARIAKLEREVGILNSPAVTEKELP